MIELYLKTLFDSLARVYDLRLEEGADERELYVQFGAECAYLNDPDIFISRQMVFDENFDESNRSAHNKLLLIKAKTDITKAWKDLQQALKIFGPYFTGPMTSISFQYARNRFSSGEDDFLGFYLYGHRMFHRNAPGSQADWLAKLADMLRHMATLNPATRLFVFSSDLPPIGAHTPKDAVLLHKLLESRDVSLLKSMLKENISLPYSVLEAINPKA